MVFVMVCQWRLDSFLVYAIEKRRTSAMLIFNHINSSNLPGGDPPICSVLGFEVDVSTFTIEVVSLCPIT